MNNLYDLTGIDEFTSIFAQSYEERKGKSISLLEGPLLFNKQPSEMFGEWIITSDEQFPTEDDAEIIQFLMNITKQGVRVIYFASPRGTNEFEQQAKGLGIKILLFGEEGAAVEDMVDFVHEVLEVEFQEVGQSKVEVETVTQVDKEAVIVSSPVFESAVSEQQAVTSKPTIRVRVVEPQQMQNADSKLPRAIIISGAPGVGTTFIGIQLATYLSQSNHVNYIEAGVRPVLPTWFNKDGECGAALLSEQPSYKSNFRVGNNVSVYSIDTFSDSGEVILPNIARNIQGWSDTSLIDMGLQDYDESSGYKWSLNDLRILVTNADYHRCRWLEGVPADVVVINQAPKRLPIDPQEFQEFWPGAQLVFVPFVDEQFGSIIQGSPAWLRQENLRESIKQLSEIVEQGGVNLDPAAGWK
ncbi:hypothetical protein [Alicyclobacillus fodiniaquatilis]|uniref:Uncharacterized protein n=1 Tax=Alicyclobacillus fodiniaquatilis TaxID=1661150 RepID=A0ABW4JMK6_9BACL